MKEIILETYEDLKNELNKRINIIIKRQEKIKIKIILKNY